MHLPVINRAEHFKTSSISKLDMCIHWMIHKKKHHWEENRVILFLNSIPLLPINKYNSQSGKTNMFFNHNVVKRGTTTTKQNSVELDQRTCPSMFQEYEGNKFKVVRCFLCEIIMQNTINTQYTTGNLKQIIQEEDLIFTLHWLVWYFLFQNYDPYF